MKRTTIEIDEDLLARAKRALGLGTTRATVEEALRRAADQGDAEFAELRERQLRLLQHFDAGIDAQVLASEDMWR
ncbi:MAG TPA: type II toxin-antitoxin system VapB family antitoxin [Sporichthyaceae bacterium]|jgi:Arc/MetJ family transcription regulator